MNIVFWIGLGMALAGLGICLLRTNRGIMEPKSILIAAGGAILFYTGFIIAVAGWATGSIIGK